MYQANLSYKVLQRYLTEIIAAALVTFQDANQIYSLTGKGYQYLNAYKEYAKCSKSMEKRLNEVITKKKALESLCPAKPPELQYAK
jgi:hypothetical protein